MTLEILIVDDHEPLRKAIDDMLALEDDVLVVGEAVNGSDAIKSNRELMPDIIFLDIKMPEMDGLQAIKALIKDNPNSKIIMLSVFKDDSHVNESIRLGAYAYVCKDELFDEITKILLNIRAQKSIVYPQ